MAGPYREPAPPPKYPFTELPPEYFELLMFRRQHRDLWESWEEIEALTRMQQDIQLATWPAFRAFFEGFALIFRFPKIRRPKRKRRRLSRRTDEWLWRRGL